eukprot:5938211-Pleurochrysis_carterae.AAC.1
MRTRAVLIWTFFKIRRDWQLDRRREQGRRRDFLSAISIRLLIDVKRGRIRRKLGYISDGRRLAGFGIGTNAGICAARRGTAASSSIQALTRRRGGRARTAREGRTKLRLRLRPALHERACASVLARGCLLYTSPSPRDGLLS